MENEVVQVAEAVVTGNSIGDGLKYIGAGLASLGMVGAAIGVGNLTAAGLSGIARNPSASGKITKLFLFGAAFAEGLGLFAFVLAIVILG